MAKTATSTLTQGEQAKARLDARLDEALEATFPASDPVAISPLGRESGGGVLRDNEADHRFEFDTDGSTAIAVYRLSPGVVTVTHTEVPEELRGKGIGSALVEAVLGEIRRRGLKVVPRCPFVAAFIERHRDYQDLIA